MFMDQHFSFMPTNYLRSGLIESVSPKLGDIRCDWKNRLLSLWPNELFIFGAGSLKWLNGSDTLNIFVWLFGLKLFSELPGMFTGADVPCKIPATVMRILMGYSDCAIDRLSQRDSLSLELITLDPVLEFSSSEFEHFKFKTDDSSYPSYVQSNNQLQNNIHLVLNGWQNECVFTRDGIWQLRSRYIERCCRTLH